MATKSFVERASEAARKCLDAMQELVMLRDSSTRMLLSIHQSSDGSLETFREASERLSKATEVLATDYHNASRRIAKARSNVGPCTLCNVSAQTAHEVTLKLAKKVLRLLGTITTRQLGDFDPDSLTDANLGFCYKILRGIGLTRLELEQLHQEVLWEYEGKCKAPPITAEEANLRAREALKNKKVKWSQRKLARKIGCSAGLVTQLSAWQAYQQELERQGKKKAPAPRAVSLTSQVLAKEGRDEPELKRLIAEQKADDMADQRQYPRRKKV